jgi:hypothetical protein
MERWREPLQVLDISPHPLELVQMPDGRVLRGAEIILAQDAVERIRLGLACIRCLEPFEASFPYRCPVCNFAVRRWQTEQFGREYVGDVRLGPRVSLEEEAAGIRERAEKEEGNA